MCVCVCVRAAITHNFSLIGVAVKSKMKINLFGQTALTVTHRSISSAAPRAMAAMSS